MNFLVIWEEVPERTRIYELSTIDHDHLTPKLFASHRQMIGAVGCPAEVQDFLCSLDLDEIANKVYDSDGEDGHPPSVIDGKFHVIVTGQLL